MAQPESKAVVVSGRPASVNVGGEFPLPGIDGRPVEFRQFGTQLDLVAVTTGNNQVRLEIRARVSELDDAHAIVISGARVPRLNVREFNTAIEMAFGQTAVLSGLVQKRTESRRTAIGRSSSARCSGRSGPSTQASVWSSSRMFAPV